ncbi:MAG TPA: hypothetical protein VIQ79_13065 [Kribbella sp.]
MADRTVRVRLEADISDFVSDIGVKAVAAVRKLESAADGADKRISTVGAKTTIGDLGTKAEVAGAKVTKAGAAAEAAGRKIETSAKGAGVELDKLGRSSQDVDRSVDSMSKTLGNASKVTDSHANAIGRLRVAQLRLAEVQNKSNSKAATVAAAEESVRAAERAVKKFEEAGQRSGRGFGSGLKKWLTGAGADLGSQGGTVFGSGFLGALKAPVIGPLLIAVLTAAVLTALPAVGAVGAGAFVSAFGAALTVLPAVFAAKSVAVKNEWNRTLWAMGADMRVLSAPFESTLSRMAQVARETFAEFTPALQSAFRLLAPTLTTFGEQIGKAFAELEPAVRPLSEAFANVLSDLGPATQQAIALISTGLRDLSASVKASPGALGDLITGVGQLTKTLLDGLAILNNINSAFEALPGGASLVTRTMNTLNAAVSAALGPFALISKGMEAVGLKAKDMSKDVDEAAASTVDAGRTLGLWTQGLDQGALAARGIDTASLGASKSLDASLQSMLGAGNAAAGAAPKAESLATKFERQKRATDALVESLFRLQNIQLQLSGAQISFQEALDNAAQSLKDNGKTLDINTEKGRANKRALDEVARAANDQTQAIIQSNGGLGKAYQSAAVAREGFVRLAVQMGATKPQAEAMAKSLISIPNVSREARLTANKKDLEEKLAAAKKELASKDLTKERKAQLTANIKKLQDGIAAAQRALNSVPPSKTVTITTRMIQERIIRTQTTATTGGHAPTNADGGYYPRGMYPSYANGKLPTQATIQPGKGGGLVQWAEAETGGEAFIPLAPSKRDRSEKILGAVADTFGMKLVKSFASGGFRLPGGQLVDIALILQQLGLPFNPIAGINYSSTLTAANRANRAVVPARNNAIAAQRAEDAAKAQQAAIQRAITLQQRAVAAARAGNPKTKAGQAAEDRRVAAEQAKLIKLQDQLYAAKLKVTKATKASNAADALYKIRAEAAAKAAQANRDALEKLVQQQQAAVELAKQVSDSLQGQANIGDLFQQSLTGKGLLADLQGKGADLEKFGKLIAQLRARKLDEELIQQIIGKGAEGGTDLAQAILDGGVSLVNSLNKAQANLENQANKIGAGVANAQYDVKVTGRRAAGGDVTAGKKYGINENGLEWFVAPLNGAVVPAGVKPHQYIRDMAGAGVGGGGRVVREVHHHQSNNFYGMSMDEADRIAQKTQALADWQARNY